MSFPKTGKTMPTGRGGHQRLDRPSRGDFANMIALSLRRSLGGTHAAIKTAAAWTGAHERTVKNWFAGRSGPSGDHFIGLVAHSDVVLDEFLHLAGRRRCLAEMKILEAITAIRESLRALDRLAGAVGDGVS
jgi:hypothetical protein